MLIYNKRPIYKKDKREEIKNYRPVSVLSSFSKIYEKFIQGSITPFVYEFVSEFISAYRKAYSTNHVLLRSTEQWKSVLNSKTFVGSVLVDLSKIYDCIPHELLMANLHAYGFNENSLAFFCSYLKQREQNVKINNTYTLFKELPSGVRQGSI